LVAHRRSLCLHHQRRAWNAVETPAHGAADACGRGACAIQRARSDPTLSLPRHSKCASLRAPGSRADGAACGRKPFLDTLRMCRRRAAVLLHVRAVATRADCPGRATAGSALPATQPAARSSAPKLGSKSAAPLGEALTGALPLDSVAPRPFHDAPLRLQVRHITPRRTVRFAGAQCTWARAWEPRKLCLAICGLKYSLACAGGSRL
jgi:hypothetical protein